MAAILFDASARHNPYYYIGLETDAGDLTAKSPTLLIFKLSALHWYSDDFLKNNDSSIGKKLKYYLLSK